MMTQLRVSSPKEEGILQVSKWLKFQVLLDVQEMSDLLSVLAPIYLAVASEPVQEKSALISPEEFLSVYGNYVQALKEGRIPEDKAMRRTFSSLWTRSLNPLYAMSVGTESYLIRAIRPVIQLQGHQFFYSTLDAKFHPMVLGKESVSWGVQFAYPQLYQDPQSKKIAKVIASDEFPNTDVFSQLTRWMRTYTMPTPFIVDGVRTNVPMRIGRRCLSWIHQHPQLLSQGITVARIGREE